MSYLEVPVTITKDATMQYRLVGPCETAPTPADGYEIDPNPVKVSGIDGDFWVEYKIIE